MQSVTNSDIAAAFSYNDGFHLRDLGATSGYKYIAESDDPNLSSISGYTHLGVYNGHSYFSRNTTGTWTNQAAHATANSVYMLIIDSVDEWQAVRDMLYENNVTGYLWIGLWQKRDQTLNNGWFWVGKDNLEGAVNAYDPANHDTTVGASTETADNFPAILKINLN
jgi:hypothetical protein